MRGLECKGGFRRAVAVAVFWLVVPAAFAQFAPNRYALIMEDPPVASRYASRGMARTAAAVDYRQQIQARQRTLQAELAARQVQVTGSASTLLNAVFVVTPESRVSELQNLAGVTAVVPLRRYRLSLNRAADLIKAPAAWNVLGGSSNSGAGLKIAILDTGIDHTHPAFQDASLPVPDGYPRCTEGDCAYTNNKVIVARSYVRMLAAGSSLADPAADSRPDDYSARDREGHGTAIASAAAGVINSGAVTISGIAPKAYLGSYKIYGSPGVNEFSFDDVMIQALEDAIDDGMDIVSLSTGGPAFTGPLDTGSACDLPPATPCDLSATAYEIAAQAGMIVVVAAGNEGNDGLSSPTFNTISSPANAPSVIAVGATTNSHYFVESVIVRAPGAPPSLQSIEAVFGSASIPIGSVSAPLRDVSQLDNDGWACNSLPAGSLAGAFALILRGECTFAVKAANAISAGAQGVIFYMADQSPLISPAVPGLDIPVVMISNVDGLALRSYLAANPDAPVAIDSKGVAEKDYSFFDELAGFSSLGPSTGDSLVKPELVAPGTYIYMAAQNFDPLGMMYSPDRYVAASGTSFSTPLVSGAAALVAQRHPGFSAAQVKSALVNTASQEVKTDESGTAVNPQWLGAGKLDAEAAVNAIVTSAPATLSFGVLKPGALPLVRELQIKNTSLSPLVLNVSVAGVVSAIGTSISVDKPSLTLLANETESLAVTISGSLPAAGSYSGAVTIEGPGVSLRVPYLYFVAGGGAANLMGLAGSGFSRTVGQSVFLALKAVDAFGVPVSGVPVIWTAQGGGGIQSSEPVTDSYGVAEARAVLGLTPGDYSFRGAAGSLSLDFAGSARRAPTIAPGGVVNAASFEQGAPVAPGSYIAIFGSGLSDTSRANTTSPLPLAIDYVNVSFDVPSAGISAPGRLIYVSPGQVNVQVPWELQGQTSARVKVTIDSSYGNVVPVPLSDYAPAFFEIGGIAAALDTDNQVITAGNQAVRGQVVQLFANGLGPVTNRPADGEPAPITPLTETTTRPVVTIGGINATVEWSGLTPTMVGLYQINVRVPADLSPATHTITLSIGGKTSRESTLPVK